MFGWSNPTLGWAISVISAQVIGMTIDRVDGWNHTIEVVYLIEVLVLTVLAYLRTPLRLLPVFGGCRAWSSTRRSRRNPRTVGWSA